MVEGGGLLDDGLVSYHAPTREKEERDGDNLTVVIFSIGNEKRPSLDDAVLLLTT